MTDLKIKTEAISLYYRLREWGFNHAIAQSCCVDYVISMARLPLVAPSGRKRVKSKKISNK